MNSTRGGRRRVGRLRRRAPRTLTVGLPVLMVVNQTVAVVCQFVQSTDPRFLLLYFTVDSAILAGLVAVLTLAGRHGTWMWRLRLASVVGVVLSALVFAAVIAPATPTGTWFQPHDDMVVRVATVLMHGVAPIVVTVDYLMRADRRAVGASVLWSYPWPLLYLGALAALAAVVGPDVIPYPFLQPGASGWVAVVAAMAVLTVGVALVGATLSTLGRLLGRFSTTGSSN
jgi:hypothetical protein